MPVLALRMGMMTDLNSPTTTEWKCNNFIHTFPGISFTLDISVKKHGCARFGSLKREFPATSLTHNNYSHLPKMTQCSLYDTRQLCHPSLKTCISLWIDLLPCTLKMPCCIFICCTSVTSLNLCNWCYNKLWQEVKTVSRHSNRQYIAHHMSEHLCWFDTPLILGLTVLLNSNWCEKNVHEFTAIKSEMI